MGRVYGRTAGSTLFRSLYSPHVNSMRFNAIARLVFLRPDVDAGATCVTSDNSPSPPLLSMAELPLPPSTVSTFLMRTSDFVNAWRTQTLELGFGALIDRFRRPRPSFWYKKSSRGPPQFVIDSLSDSTIYMAYYTICHMR